MNSDHTTDTKTWCDNCFGVTNTGNGKCASCNQPRFPQPWDGAKFVVTDDGRDAPRVHRAGCADIVRKDERIIGWGDTPEAAAIEAHEDFINEGSMTADQALSSCHIIGCAR